MKENKAKPAHTPTPWTFDSCKTVRLLSLDHKIEIGSLWLKTEQAETDAAFIVRAVNSHEELLETLKAARRELNDSHRYDYIDEAIAKAEGK
jgi:hypothetical protein